MKLVFDENLSPKLPNRLSGAFADSTHVESLGFKGEDDKCIWQHVKQLEGAVIVSKDDDFRELALLDGPPPKVIALRIGNCSTQQIETLLRQHRSQIVEFFYNAESALFEIFSGK